MTSIRRVLALLLAISLLATSAAATWADSGHRRPDAVPRATSFFGIDGWLYPVSPMVIQGRDGEKFYGPDFDLACGYGQHLQRSMRRLSGLARVIEHSGRKVIFTVVPNKSSVLTTRIEPSLLPHGACDAEGLAEQRRVLDHFSDPNYLALRRTLHGANYQTYWQTDLHWTSVGASLYTQLLANRLSRRLGREQSYSMDQFTGLGGLNALMNDPTEETVLTASSANGVHVSPAVPSEEAMRDITWRSSPARRTWPGRTLVVGDSMTSAAWNTLPQLFHHGRFMWLGYVTTREIAEAIAESDTIVLETAQLFLPVNDLVTPALRRQVGRALRDS